MDNNRFYFKKSLGQNFLTDRNIMAKIAGIILGLEPQRVFDIGPGEGRIAEMLAGRLPLVLIEKDERLIKDLENRLPGSVIINSDIRDIKLNDYAVCGNDLLFSNLPYSASTSILQFLLRQRPQFGNYILMFQREVARRLKAPVNDSNYGFISVFTQLHCRVKSLFTLPPSVFKPKPEVYSELVHLVPVNKVYFRNEKEEQEFYGFVKRAFSQKRKKLRSNIPALRIIEGEKGRLSQMRPHQVSPEEYLALFTQIQAQSACPAVHGRGPR